MTPLPKIGSGLLLLGGAIAWLLGPGAPAQPRGAALAAGPAEPWGAEEVWLEGPVDDPEEPEPRTSAAQDAFETIPVEPFEAVPAEPSESAFEEAPVDEPHPAPRDADASLDLVRRMLAVHARMAEP